MDIFFQDPDDVPLPPKEVHIRQLTADPWPDGQRVRIYLELSPFQKRPNGEINVIDANGDEVASMTIIETIDRKMDLTLHLRGRETGGEYIVFTTIYYPEYEKKDESADAERREELALPTGYLVVDRAETSFTIQS